MRVCKHGCEVFQIFAPIFKNYFIKAIMHVFLVYVISSKHSKEWENRPFSLVHFPNTDHVMILRRFDPLSCSLKQAWICLHAFILMNRTKDQNSWVSSHDLYWENKIYKRKRSILESYADPILNCLEFSQSSSCLDEAMQTRKKCSIA